MKLLTLLLTIICVLGFAMYAEGRLGSAAEIQRRRLMPGFIGSSFRHAVNNQRPEVQQANRNGIIKALQSTFQQPGDIPLTKKDAYAKTVEFGVKMHQNGYGSKGMGNWQRDEMIDGDEMIGSYSPGNNQRYWNRL